MEAAVPTFSDTADVLRRHVEAYYEDRADAPQGNAYSDTLETNSSLVERRAAPLVALFQRRTGAESLQGLQVVDLGCGFGSLSIYFGHLGAEVTGIDPIGSRLNVGRAVARECCIRASFHRERMQETELSPESFDLAVANNSLCYLVGRADRRLALDATLRLLRPGGWLIVRNPNRLHPRDQFTGLPFIQLLGPTAAVRVASWAGHDRSLVRTVTPRGAARELRSSGFVDVLRERSPGSRWPAVLTSFARYQVLSGRRPAA